MILKLQTADLARVADIWLDTNIKAHHFISARYWQDHFEEVKQMLPQAEVYIYKGEKTGRIEGFIGLESEYIAGIFVCGQAQSQGIGRQLMEFIKSKKARLFLRVYQKNAAAVRFYLREQFQIQGEGLDQTTGEKEYIMAWERAPEK